MQAGTKLHERNQPIERERDSAEATTPARCRGVQTCGRRALRATRRRSEPHGGRVGRQLLDLARLGGGGAPGAAVPAAPRTVAELESENQRLESELARVI